MAYEGFRPEITLLDAPFWDALRRHELVVQQCAACGRLRFVPAELCPACYSSAATWVPVSGRGRVYTYTVVHRAPTPVYQAEAPYALAYVELDEGPRMPARLVDVDPARGRGRSAGRGRVRRRCPRPHPLPLPAGRSPMRTPERQLAACQSMRAMRCDAGTACSAPCSSSSTATIP